MTINFDSIIEEELASLDALIADYKIPVELINDLGKSFFMAEIYSASQIMGDQAKEFSNLLSVELEKNNQLYQALPNVPLMTIRAICMAYTILTNKKLFQDSDDEGLVKLMMAVAVFRGYAMSNSPNQVAALLHEVNLSQREMLSKAGAKGALEKLKPYEALKTWALEKAETMRGQDVDIARKLSAQIPNHLSDVSRNSERLIYDALRAKRSSN